MRTVAFDILGNDNGPLAALNAVKEFISTNKNYKFILVGPKDKILEVFPNETPNIEVVDCSKEIQGELGARAARGEENSMSLAISLVKDGKAEAVISAGSSGAYLTMATLILKRMEGIKRPAFMPIFPTIVKGQKFVLLDAGANLEIDSEIGVQWAFLGSAFAKAVLNVENPRVSIINVGTEDEKGLEWAREAHQVLKEKKNINYVGFIESRDLLKAKVDVAVIDGYGGNLVLKTMEGTALSMLKLIKESLTSKLKYKIGALIAKGGFVEAKERLDYRNVGAAWIAGLNGLALKVHGGSDKKAYMGALKQVELALEKNALEKFKEALINVE